MLNSSGIENGVHGVMYAGVKFHPFHLPGCAIGQNADPVCSDIFIFIKQVRCVLVIC